MVENESLRKGLVLRWLVNTLCRRKRELDQTLSKSMQDSIHPSRVTDETHKSDLTQRARQRTCTQATTTTTASGRSSSRAQTTAHEGSTRLDHADKGAAKI